MTEMFLVLSLQKPNGSTFTQVTFTGAFSVAPQSTPSDVYALVMEKVIPQEWRGACVLFFSAVPNTPTGGAL